MKFGHLIFRKTSKVIATRCHILWLKYNKLNSVSAGVPQILLGELTALPDLAGFEGPTSKGGKGQFGEWDGERLE